MTRKTTKSYKALFSYIEDQIFEMQPAEFMTDFEDGMRLAIKICWPKVKVRGCWFHYCRAILRRCRNLGMDKLLKNNENAKAVKRQLAVLPLLPEGQIEEGFKATKKLAAKKKLSKRFGRLFKYVESYWLKSQVKIDISYKSYNERGVNGHFVNIADSFMNNFEHPYISYFEI